MMRLRVAAVALLCVIGTGWAVSAPHEPKPPKPPKPAKDKLGDELRQVLLRVVEAEPSQVGTYHTMLRSTANIINGPSTPVVVFNYPSDGAIIDGAEIVLSVGIANWMVDPSRATSAGTEFAIGAIEQGVGHTHVWIYDMASGARVRFTGATGLAAGSDGNYYSAAFSLPPGVYKAYVQLQNHDHTGPIPASAQSLPPFDAVVFEVAAPDDTVSSRARGGSYWFNERMAAAYRNPRLNDAMCGAP